MPSDRTTRFIEALHDLEQGGSPDRIVALHGDRIALASLARRAIGKADARRFWTDYRAQFQAIASSFDHVIEQDDRAVLVWTSRGALAQGQPISYRGVSILTFADDHLAQFETIYGSAAFTRPATAVGAVSVAQSSEEPEQRPFKGYG